MPISARRFSRSAARQDRRSKGGGAGGDPPGNYGQFTHEATPWFDSRRLRQHTPKAHAAFSVFFLVRLHAKRLVQRLASLTA